MFGNKKRDGAHRFGALRSASPAVAPSLEFRGSGREPRVDLRQWCSPVETQDPLGSCNACSVVGALEYLMLKSGQPLVNLSVLYVYYWGRKLAGVEDQDAGLMCHHATAAVMAYGACEDKLWPYKPERFTREPSKEAQENARRFDAVQYARVSTADEARMSLSQGLPVVFGFDIPYSYYKDAESSGRMPGAGKYDTEPYCGHAMLVVGYDDTAGTWLAKNSWGPNWGERGYLHIPYDVAAKYVWNDEMWVIGALERVEKARLVGPTIADAVRDVEQHGSQQMKEALEALRKDVREDLEKDLEDAKKSIRDRLRGA